MYKNNYVWEACPFCERKITLQGNEYPITAGCKHCGWFTKGCYSAAAALEAVQEFIRLLPPIFRVENYSLVKYSTRRYSSELVQGIGIVESRKFSEPSVLLIDPIALRGVEIVHTEILEYPWEMDKETIKGFFESVSPDFSGLWYHINGLVEKCKNNYEYLLADE